MDKTMDKSETSHAQIKLDMPFEEALQRFSNVNMGETEETPLEEGKPYPFVKWAGGKRGIIDELVMRLPSTFKDYYEPFLGGGALFFEICDRLERAFLSDKNLDLVITYNVIKKDYKKLIPLLRTHKENNTEGYYYKLREKQNLQDPIEVAGRFIYLNKTCYNGLWRTNRKGEFNVPVGRYENPNIVQEGNIKACHNALQCATITYSDFEMVSPKKDDFIYIDPPYHPTDEKSFTKYTKLDFTEKDQIRLRDYILSLHKKGAKVMISNSKTEFIESLFKDKIFNIDIVSAPRFVNCKSDKRQPVEEVLITNYTDYDRSTRWNQSKLHGKDS